MTTGDGLQSGGRASEAELLKRLAERRTDYERAEAETRSGSGFARLFSRGKPGVARTPNKSNRWEPRDPALGSRRRPVAAYLTMTVVSAATVGAVALLAMSSGGDAASSGPATSTARTSTAEASLERAANVPLETAMKPSPNDTTAPETAPKAEAEPAVATVSDTAARLRPTTEDLPASAAPAADPVAVALALRLPAAPGEAVVGMPADLLTTGSIVSPVGQRPVVDVPAGNDAEPAMARWAIADTELATPVTQPTLSDDEMEIAALNATGDDTAAIDESPDGAAATPTEAEATSTAKVTVAVNMRAKPANGAKVVAVLAKGRSVEVINCEMWCEISADGKRGFVYKSFVNRRG